MDKRGLTPDELKWQHAEKIAKSNTFATQGVSHQKAADYLDTPEGMIYERRLIEANPTASLSRIRDRAIEQIRSGHDLPRMEVINEPLVKIVPTGERVSPYSPFFAKRSEFEDALAKGHNLSDRFGLPIKSEATVYDAYEIRPKGPTETFVSRVAATSELGGQVTKAGGAEQYLVPNRGLYTEAVRVTSLGNDLALHNERVVSKGLGAPIAALSAEPSATRGLRSTAVKGLGAAGAVVTGYDAADTFHDAARLRSQGNATAAQAQIERFAIRNLSGWGGAVAGLSAGAMAGVESGPGLLVTGAIGGIVGAVAGDEVADWLNDRKINRQQDPQGNTWTFDPDHAEKGWTRTQRELDVQAMSATTVEMPIYKTHTLTADAALSDRLTFQASSTAIKLALGAPPQSRDPYTLPANAQDTPSLLARDWRYNADRSVWQREVVDQIHDHGIEITHTETASPQRAAQLDSVAQAIIAKNAMQTPAAMAAQYQAAHERHGWSQYGSVPEAVTEAIRHPGRVVGSDGGLYERNAQGQWTDDGVLWDSQAQGNLRRELDATWQQQNANLRTPHAGLHTPTRVQENITTLDTVEVYAPREAAYPQSDGTSPVQGHEDTRSAPASQTPAPGPSQASVPSIPDHLRDFRHPEHPGTRATSAS
jgi:hypothetical protein